MNASDIIKAKQNCILYQAYYRPTIFPGTQDSVSTLINSTITYYPVSSVSSADNFISSVVSSITLNYLYKCEKPVISYELMNSINQGKYLSKFPYCSTLSEWNTGQIFTAGNCNCKESSLTWKNTTTDFVYHYSSISYSSVTVTSSLVATGPSPIICPLVDFYQGTSFTNRCSICNTIMYGDNVSCCCDC